MNGGPSRSRASRRKLKVSKFKSADAQEIICLTVNAKGFRPLLTKPGPRGLYLLRTGALPLLEREALEKFGDAGVLAAVGDMLDIMGTGEDDKEWVLSTTERSVSSIISR